MPILAKETLKEAKKIKKRWKLDAIVNDIAMFTYSKYKVMFSIEQHPNGRWRHASITYREKATLPTWGDIRMMKDDFFGTDVFAIQILPPDRDYVNVHVYCMHLWQYLDGDNWPIEREQCD